MKLIKCYVSSFGKLKDFSFDFSSGLNTIKQENGWGKSTLATFVKAMFYGLDGNNKRSISDNERKKYKPWNSTQTFGGFVHFEWGGNEYVIERYFGNKDSEDTVKLTDVKTGKSYPNTENLGRRIFEIDEEGFLSTTYFSQKDFEIKSNTSLTAKFNAMCESGDSEAFDKALVSLSKKIKDYKYSGDRGLIPDAKREIYAVNEEIERAQNAQNAIVQLKKDMLEREALSAQISKKTEQLAKRVAAAGKAEALKDKKARYDKLIAERNALIENKTAAESVLNGNAVSKVEISPYESKAREIDVLSEKIVSINSDLSLLEQTHNQEKEKKNKGGLYVLLGTCSAVSLLAAVILFLFGGSLFFLGFIGAAAFVSSILSLYVVAKKAKKNTQQQQTPYALMTTAKKEELGKCLRIKSEYQNEVDAYISRFNLGESFDRVTALANIAKVAEVYNKICADLELIDYELSVLSADKKEFESLENESENIAILEIELRRAQDEYTKNSIQLASIRSAIKTHEERASTIIDLENKKSEINEKIARYEEQLKIFTLTEKYLKAADENLKIKYRAPLQESLNKYLSYISGQTNAKIDVDMTVTIQESGGEKSTEYYSKGYQNLFEICKRFALTDVLFKKEKPFIILDDPFYNLDDKKVEESLALIKKLSEEYQIIYFVCHESRRA